MTADVDEGAHLTWPEPGPPLNQPRRGLIAAVEAVAAAGLVVLALWLWNLGVVRVSPLPDRPELEFTQLSGDLVALSIAAGAAAALALLDALRNTVLAVRTRRKP